MSVANVTTMVGVVSYLPSCTRREIEGSEIRWAIDRRGIGWG